MTKIKTKPILEGDGERALLALKLIKKHLLVPAIAAAKPFLSSVYIDILFVVKILVAGVAKA